MTSFRMAPIAERARKSPFIFVVRVRKTWVCDGQSYAELPATTAFRLGPGCGYRKFSEIVIMSCLRYNGETVQEGGSYNNGNTNVVQVLPDDIILMEHTTAPIQGGTNAMLASEVAGRAATDVIVLLSALRPVPAELVSTYVSSAFVPKALGILPFPAQPWASMSKLPEVSALL
eukprot:PhM_4_TR4163/c0_g1_i1/m.8528